MANPGPLRPADMLFPERREAIYRNKCVHCDKPAVEFKDTVSITEYTISGLCQSCQDRTFG